MLFSVFQSFFVIIDNSDLPCKPFGFSVYRGPYSLRLPRMARKDGRQHCHDNCAAGNMWTCVNVVGQSMPITVSLGSTAAKQEHYPIFRRIRLMPISQMKNSPFIDVLPRLFIVFEAIPLSSSIGPNRVR